MTWPTRNRLRAEQLEVVLQSQRRMSYSCWWGEGKGRRAACRSRLAGAVPGYKVPESEYSSRCLHQLILLRRLQTAAMVKLEGKKVVVFYLDTNNKLHADISYFNHKEDAVQSLFKLKQQEASFGKNTQKCTQEVTKRSFLKPNTFLLHPEQDTGGRSLAHCPSV